MAESISADPPTELNRVVFTQSWLDLGFVHWQVEPAVVAPLLPAGTVVDTFDGAAHVGLVPFRMHRAGWMGTPGLPYLGTFPEINVRLYTVDGQGRRGVAFRSLDAARLAAVLTARRVYRLPYVWSRMRVHRSDNTVTYTSRRRWPGPRGAGGRLRLRVGAPIAQPDALQHFLTARWGLHTVVGGRLLWMPNRHRRWPLHHAELVECSLDLLSAAGLPQPAGPPLSVLYSPGVAVRFGPAVPAEAPR